LDDVLAAYSCGVETGDVRTDARVIVGEHSYGDRRYEYDCECDSINHPVCLDGVERRGDLETSATAKLLTML
jgi:hypothetical protein